jgi:hypothetical protein
MVATCRYCEYYDLSTAKSASGAVLSNRVALCLFPIERLERKVPLSVQRFRGPAIAPPGYMQPNDGTGCPQFVKLPVQP